MEPRERVVMKSIELFALSGIRLVTMDQIAAELGMSKRTIYELFKDKDTLVRECLETMRDQHMEELREMLARSSNVIEALYLVGQHGEKKKVAFNRLFFEDLKKLYPNMWESVKRGANKNEESFSCAIIRRGMKEGIFHSELNVMVVDAFIRMMMEIFHQRESFPENTTDEDMIRNIIIPYYMGISTQKGQKLLKQYFPITLT